MTMTHPDTENASIETLLEIMSRLRDPEHGCPWDLEQDFRSIAPYTLEEAYEVVDAIERDDREELQHELGDLLFQTVFHARMAEEAGWFDFSDVVRGICDKLVRRHPHVFARENRDFTETELDTQWESIKRSEATHNKSCLADHLPGKLPALQRAQKLIARSYKAKRHQELPDYNELTEKIPMLTMHANKTALDEESLGMLLMQIVRMSHDAGLYAETALRKTTRQLLQELDRD